MRRRRRRRRADLTKHTRRVRSVRSAPRQGHGVGRGLCAWPWRRRKRCIVSHCCVYVAMSFSMRSMNERASGCVRVRAWSRTSYPSEPGRACELAASSVKRPAPSIMSLTSWEDTLRGRSPSVSSPRPTCHGRDGGGGVTRVTCHGRDGGVTRVRSPSVSSPKPTCCSRGWSSSSLGLSTERESAFQSTTAAPTERREKIPRSSCRGWRHRRGSLASSVTCGTRGRYWEGTRRVLGR